jgi:rubrerythrin
MIQIPNDTVVCFKDKGQFIEGIVKDYIASEQYPYKVYNTPNCYYTRTESELYKGNLEVITMLEKNYRGAVKNLQEDITHSTLELRDQIRKLEQQIEQETLKIIQEHETEIKESKLAFFSRRADYIKPSCNHVWVKSKEITACRKCGEIEGDFEDLA